MREVVIESKETDNAPLDKWGLPPPTVEDIFPLLPPETEIVPQYDQNSSIQAVKEATKNHIPLNFDRFDEEGVEKDAEGNPMRIRVKHVSPPVLTIENFFTPKECQEMMDHPEKLLGSSSGPVEVDSATFSPLAQSKRTSTSWFCHYASTPTLLAKANSLGIPLVQMEEPQIVRYRQGQEFSWHYDEVPAPQLNNGGQRLMTLLVYLNDVKNGGGTIFRDLCDDNENELTVQPKRGTALLFFPALADGTPDDRTLHRGQAVEGDDEKWIIQMWIHADTYTAAVPAGNSQAAAMLVVEKQKSRLGYE